MHLHKRILLLVVDKSRPQFQHRLLNDAEFSSILNIYLYESHYHIMGEAVMVEVHILCTRQTSGDN